MKVSEVINKLTEIREKYGDLEIVGGHLSDDSSLRGISVVDTEGMEVFPCDPNGAAGRNPVEGVFLQA